MKTFLLLFIFLCIFITNSNSQPNFRDSIKSDIGASMIPLLTLSGIQVSSGNVLLQFRRFYKKTAFRISFYNNTKLDEGYVNDFDQFAKNISGKDTFLNFYKDKTYKTAAGFRPGFEWDEIYGSRWCINYGVDLIIGYTESSDYRTTLKYKVVDDSAYYVSVSVENKTAGQTWMRTGISPSIGVEYYINKKFSIKAEGCFDLYHDELMSSGPGNNSINGETVFYLNINYKLGKK